MLKIVSPRRSIVMWLYLCIFLVICMISLGGATRLTGSGLSIVEWKPITGILPPFTHEAWLMEFEKYKQFPEYSQRHNGFSLSDFQFIFYMEYVHRLLGRLLGFVFLVPFFFLWKSFTSSLKWRFILILLLLGTQGGIGWFMVKSGLVSDPHVSHYRLAIHLGLALLILALLVEALFTFITEIPLPMKLKPLACFCLFWVGTTVIYGAFLAGLRGGVLYNTFPKMGEEWIPSEWLFQTPWYINFTENPVTVQWGHRILAVGSFILCFLLGRALWVNRYYSESLLLISIVMVQFTLGVLTVLFVVPLSLALLHQLGAVVLCWYLFVLFLRMKDRRLFI